MDVNEGNDVGGPRWCDDDGIASRGAPPGDSGGLSLPWCSGGPDDRWCPGG